MVSFRLFAPVFLCDVGCLELHAALGDRFDLVVGPALLALHYLADYGIVRYCDVAAAFVAFCLQLTSHLSFQVSAHECAKTSPGFVESVLFF